MCCGVTPSIFATSATFRASLRFSSISMSFIAVELLNNQPGHQKHLRSNPSVLVCKRHEYAVITNPFARGELLIVCSELTKRVGIRADRNSAAREGVVAHFITSGSNATRAQTGQGIFNLDT